MAADDDIQDSSAPLIEHLAELRQRLIYSFVAFIIGMITVSYTHLTLPTIYSV